MERHTGNKRLLLGSMSIVSTVALISVAIGPSLFLNNPENEVDKGFSLRDFWDIIVPDDFNTIQKAVDSAVSGDRIYVRSGEYEVSRRITSIGIRIKTQGLTIHGENKDNTFINSLRMSDSVIIAADYTNFSGFTLKNNGVNGTLLSVSSNNNIIENNVFEVNDFYDGIEYAMKLFNTQNNVFADNLITGEDRGIYVTSSSNNLFENNTIINNNVGISVSRNSNSNSFIDNIVSDNRIGISLSYSSDIVVFNNSFISNNKNGLGFSSCTKAVIKNNVFIDDGLDIWGSELSHFVHDVEGNLVNDKPLYYYYNKNSFTVPSDAGQVIIVYCNDVDVKNVKISNTSTAVFIAFSSNVRVIDSDFRYCSRGVFLYYSGNNYINRNNFIDNGRSAGFVYKGFIGSKSNSWSNNYWGERLLKRFPKIIRGRIILKRNFRILKRFQPGIPTRNFDLRPAKKPF